jgi:hypothetical protein
MVMVGLVLMLAGVCWPLLSDMLPVDSDRLQGGAHAYYRLVPGDEATRPVPALLIVVGVVLCGTAIVRHRRGKSADS